VGQREFAAGAGAGSRAAWKALQDPREGTILSVIGAWSHELSTRSDRTEDFAEALGQALVAARLALARDSASAGGARPQQGRRRGGQGFVFFLEGISEWMRTGEARQAAAPPPPAEPQLFAAAHAEVDPTYRFCAEALLSGCRPRP